WCGFSIDRIIKRLGGAESPVRGAFLAASIPDELSLQRYQWLIERSESMLAHIGSYKVLYEEEMAVVQAELDAGMRGAIELRHMPQIAVSVMHTDGPRHRMTLNTLAGAYRVLHVQSKQGDTCYRYHDRTESWFDMVSLRAPPRRDLRPLAQRLAHLEPEHDGASWQADAPNSPIPELYFGVPSEQPYG